MDRRGLKNEHAVEKLKQSRSQGSQEPIANQMDTPLTVKSEKNILVYHLI